MQNKIYAHKFSIALPTIVFALIWIVVAFSFRKKPTPPFRAILNVGFFGRILPNADQKPLLSSYKKTLVHLEKVGSYNLGWTVGYGRMDANKRLNSVDLHKWGRIPVNKRY